MSFFLRKKTGMEFFIHTRKCIPELVHFLLVELEGRVDNVLDF